MSITSAMNQINDYSKAKFALSTEENGGPAPRFSPCYHFGLMTIEIRLNGESQELPASFTVSQLLDHFGLPKERVAVERNRSIVPKAKWDFESVGSGDEVEVVHFVGGGEADGNLVIAGKPFQSRLLVGTGKYPSHQVMKECHERSGTDMVTVAVRRTDRGHTHSREGRIRRTSVHQRRSRCRAAAHRCRRFRHHAAGCADRFGD